MEIFTNFMKKSSSKESPTPLNTDLYSDEQLNNLLNELVLSQSLPETTLDKLKDLPRESKLTLLTKHLADRDSIMDTPDQYIQAVLRKPMKEIGKLRMALNTKPVSFVIEFASKNGLDVIKDLLYDAVPFFILESDFHEKQLDDHPFLFYKTKKSREQCEKLSYEAAQCVKPLIKLSEILKTIATDDVLLTLLCIYTTFGSYLTRKIACETLTVVLYYDSNLVGKVMQCFTNSIEIKDSIIRQHYRHPLENQTNLYQIVQDKKMLENPFNDWIDSFDNVLLGRGILGSKVHSNLIDNMTEDQLNDFALSNWILINGFLRVPTSIPLRIHIRNLMLAANLKKILDACVRMNNELIGWQLKQYREDEKLDLKWFNDVNQLKMQDFQDPSECLDYLLRKTQHYPSAYFYLTKLMQLLTLIRDDPEQQFDVHVQYLKLISNLVEKIVLDNQGIDPSFTNLYGVSVSSIIEGLANQEQVEQLKNAVKDSDIKLNLLRKEKAKVILQTVDDGNTKVVHSQQIDHLTDLLNISQSNTDALQDQIKELDEKYRNVLKNHDMHLEKLLKALKESNDLSQLDQMKEMLSNDFATNFPTVASSSNPSQIDSLKGENARLRDQLKILRHRQTAIAAPFGQQDTRPATPPNQGKSEFKKILEKQAKKSNKNLESKSESVGIPPPPPPPQLSGSAFVKKYEPKTQLKQLNWEKMPEHATRDTIFGNLNFNIEDVMQNTNVFGEMEEMFGNQVKTSSRADSELNLNDNENQGSLFVSHSAPSIDLKHGAEISVLDAKKAYNVNIMLQRIKHITPFEIKQAVIEINKDILTPLLIQQLNKFMPTSKEIGKLQAYKHNRANLSKVDNFFVELFEINRLSKRLEIIEFMYSYDERHQDIERFIFTLNKGCLELKNSKSFSKVLEMVLALGNFMNSGHRGGAYGFKITSINKLSDTKSYDNSTTLLHFLAKITKNKFPDALNFVNEFNGINDASKIDITYAKQELRVLGKGLNDLHDEFDLLEIENLDVFKAKLTKFHKVNVERNNKLKLAFGEVEKLFNSTCKLYGENPSKMSCEEFFGIFSTFKTSFEVFDINLESFARYK
eukprot:NODE_137_length_18042_cov_0.768823.p2 type:complete len:1084 gc:universal NODE_137_length_18042_cov_0.768823:2637-5888(+)